MKYLFLLLLLTACGAPNNVAQTDSTKNKSESSTNLAVGFSEIKIPSLQIAAWNTHISRMLKIENFLFEQQVFHSSEGSITNYPEVPLSLQQEIALRTELPPNMSGVNLKKVEDNFGEYSMYYYTDKGFSLGEDEQIKQKGNIYYAEVYLDEEAFSYYYGMLLPLNDFISNDSTMDGGSAQRFVLITNLTPSLRIFADCAYSPAPLYWQNLRQTIDYYVVEETIEGTPIFVTRKWRRVQDPLYFALADDASYVLTAQKNTDKKTPLPRIKSGYFRGMAAKGFAGGDINDIMDEYSPLFPSL